MNVRQREEKRWRLYEKREEMMPPAGLFLQRPHGTADTRRQSSLVGRGPVLQPWRLATSQHLRPLAGNWSGGYSTETKFNVFYLPLSQTFTYLFASQSHREESGWAHLPVTAWVAAMARAGSGWSQEPGSPPSLPHRAIMCYLSQASTGELHWKWNCWDRNQHLRGMRAWEAAVSKTGILTSRLTARFRTPVFKLYTNLLPL